MIFKEQHVGVGKLRLFHSGALRKLNSEDAVYVLGQYGEPLAVLIGYDLFLKVQNALEILKTKLGPDHFKIEKERAG